MKRIVSSVLILAIVLSFSPIPVNADSNENNKMIDIMSSLGFLKVVDKSDLTATVTRAEFLAELMSLADIEPYDEQVYFHDVNENHRFFKQISTATGLGIVGGFDGRFNPERQISYLEAVIMAENVLGYGAYIEKKEDKMSEYLRFASEIKLNKDTNLAPSSLLCVKDVAQILYNAGNAEMLTPVFSSASEQSMKKGESLFWSKHKISKGNGVLLANQYTSIDGLGATEKDKVRIGGFSGYLYYNSAKVDLLGYFVEYYYKIEDNENLICYLNQTESQNKTVVLSPSDIAGYNSSRKVFEYYVNSSKKEIDLTSGIPVVYNGMFTSGYYRTYGTVTKPIFDIVSGDITLIDNDSNGKYDVINIISLESFVVSGIDQTKKIIYGLYGNESSLNFGGADDDSWIITDKDGKIIPFSDVKEKDVMSYVKSDDAKYFHAVISRERKIGAISSIHIDDGNMTVVTIGQETFKISDLFLNNDSQMAISVGNDVELYLDYKGDVVFAECKDNDSSGGSIVTSGYAFVISKKFKRKEDRYVLNLLIQNGKIETIPLAEKVTIDGVRYKQGAINTFMAGFDDYQMIVFKLNNDNELSVIDTTTVNGNDSQDKLRSFLTEPTDLMWENRVGTFGSDIEKKGKIITDSNTKVFKVPPKGEAQYDESLYSVTTMPTTITKYKVNAFSNNPQSFIADAIQYVSGGGNSSMSVSSPSMLIEKVYRGLNNFDEPTLILKGYVGSNLVELCLDSDYDASKQNTTFPGVDANNLEPGDLIKYTTNAYGDIDYVSDIYNYSTGTLGNFPLLTNGSIIFSSATFWGTFGWILAKEDNCFALVDNVTDLNSSNLNPMNVNSVVRIQKDTTIYKVTGTNRVEIEKIPYENLSAIADYKNNHVTSKAIVMGGQGYPYIVVVYQD
jgi:hypothetical protein